MTTIKCANISGHGTEALADVIANSCNDAMMQIGAKMGKDNFLKAQSLSISEQNGIDLPNEGYGVIHTSDTMGETELACSAFGQGLQLYHDPGDQCNVFCHQWRLLLSATSGDKIKDSSGATVKTISPILMKQTISSRRYLLISDPICRPV